MKYIKYARMYLSFAMLFVFTILALPFFLMILIITNDSLKVSMILDDIGLALKEGTENSFNKIQP